MDVLSDLLHRARADTVLVRQLIQRPPWSLTFADPPSLTVVATLGGTASIRRDGAAPVPLSAGDIALIRGPESHTIADSPGTEPQVVIRNGRKHAPEGQEMTAEAQRSLAPRTYGDGLPGATTMLRGAYDLRGDVGSRLLAMLPEVAVIPANPRTRPMVNLLATEIAQDEPGQTAILNRLLNLILVLAIRAWCTDQERPPTWYQALSDHQIGRALRQLHDNPAHNWTVAELAREANLSRATFAARFKTLVGEPPLTYLTNWRMTLAADLLQERNTTVATAARTVGYKDPYAFTTAFKRTRGTTPTAWRRTNGAH